MTPDADDLGAGSIPPLVSIAIIVAAFVAVTALVVIA